MKKIFIHHHFSLFILSLFTLLLNSCDKVPINGDLDGLWQLTTIQTPESTRDVKSTRAYLSIQLHLSQWDNNGTTFYAHFVHEGDWNFTGGRVRFGEDGVKVRVNGDLVFSGSDSRLEVGGGIATTGAGARRHSPLLQKTII